MLNEILLRRKNKILLENLPKDINEDTVSYVLTIMKNVENLGYTFSKNLCNILISCTKNELNDFYLELIPLLKEYVGANVKYNPMYPNFPKSVMERDEIELYLNAIMHYWSGGKLYPVEKKNERLPLFEEIKVKVLDVGTFFDLRDIFNNLLSSKTSISQQDKDDIKWFFGNMSLELPDVIPLKENVAFVCKSYMKEFPFADSKGIQKYIKTATDVLRLIVCMSDGDISLSENTKFRSFKRRERRILLELLENCGNIEEDMKKYKNRWIRIGEKLHPFEYDFKKVNTAFKKLRENEKIDTWKGLINKNYESKNYDEVINLLHKRAGEFARDLDNILRKSDNKCKVINLFKSITKDVSTNVLLQVKEHFIHRNEGKPFRIIFPKGNLAKANCIKNTLPEIEEKYCNAIVKICENALIQKYSEKDFMGNVYLSEAFKSYLVPFSQRSASKSLRTIVRGSKLNIEPNKNTLRAFIWWTNSESGERIDVDLSASMFDENWNYMNHISYTKLKSDKFNSYHSGDIVNGGDVNGDGVAEFIDCDIQSILDGKARYIVYQVYNYSGINYSNMTHAMFGWMEREEPNDGEIFEPKTVIQKMDLTAESTIAIPVIFDCVERKVIWCDMNIGYGSSMDDVGGNNLESNLKGVILTCYSMVNLIKPNLYDLIDLHIKARGNKVDTKEEADIIFDVEDGITPFDTEIFMGEYI